MGPDVSTPRKTPQTAAWNLREIVEELCCRNPILFAVAAVNAVLFVAFSAGIVLDPTTVNGEPAWLKPTKFAGSIALVSATLSWVGIHIPVQPRFRRRVSLIVGCGFLIEIALIGGQAARGVGSHFNRTTPLDAAIGAVMGVTIVIVTGAIALLAVRARRGAFAVHPAFATGILLGLGVFVVGAVEGGIMIAIQSRTLATIGPTVPVVGWQVVGGFRLTHFVGLHALQVLPLAGYLAAGGRNGEPFVHARRLVVAVASGYALILVVTLILGVVPVLI